MSERLNPKLTKRNLAINLPLGGDQPIQPSSELPSERTATQRSNSSNESSSSGTTSSSTESEGLPPLPVPTNPKLGLIHNGKWIPKVVSLTNI